MIVSKLKISVFLFSFMLLAFSFTPTKGTFIYASYVILGLMCVWCSLLIYEKNTIKKITLALFLFSLFVFISYIFISHENKAYFIDLKNWLMISCFVFLILFRKYFFSSASSFYYIANISFLICLLIGGVYFLLYFDIVPRIYDPEDLPQYLSYRVFGPPLHSFFLYLILTAYINTSINKVMVVIFIGLSCALLSGSNQNLLLMLFSSIPVVMSKLRRGQIILLVISILLLVGIASINSSSNIEKASQIFDLKNSQTLITRYVDLMYAIESRPLNWVSILFGDGFGVTTQVYRVGEYGVDNRDFLEIDNGFYYLFHRYGLVGIILYVTWLISIFRFSNKWVSFSLFSIALVSNLLSIHFYVTFGYFLLFFIVFSVNQVLGKGFNKSSVNFT